MNDPLTPVKAILFGMWVVNSALITVALNHVHRATRGVDTMRWQQALAGACLLFGSWGWWGSRARGWWGR